METQTQQMLRFQLIHPLSKRTSRNAGSCLCYDGLFIMNGYLSITVQHFRPLLPSLYKNERHYAPHPYVSIEKMLIFSLIFQVLYSE